MNELSLFSGAGGGLLATHHLLGWRTIGYVEKDDYCQRVLAARIRDGLLGEAPIFGDIESFLGQGYAGRYRGMVDVVTAGFPCQAFSSAARGRNVAEDLAGAAVEVVAYVRPAAVLFENVDGSIGRWGDLCKDLEKLGYRIRGVIRASAASMGAPHKRGRIWMVAHAYNKEQLSEPVNVEMASPPKTSSPGWWQENPASILGMDDGLAHRMDRHKAIGNGQVPSVVERVWETLT